MANMTNGLSLFCNLNWTVSGGQKYIDENIDCTTSSVPKLAQNFIPFSKVSIRSLEQEIIQKPSCDTPDNMFKF